MESFDHVFWQYHGKDTAVSLRALMTHALSSLYPTSEHFVQE